MTRVNVVHASLFIEHFLANDVCALLGHSLHIN